MEVKDIEFIYEATNIKLHHAASKIIGRGLTDNEYNRLKYSVNQYLDHCMGKAIEELVFNSLNA